MELVDKQEVTLTNGAAKKQALIEEVITMLTGLDLPRVESVKKQAAVEVAFQELAKSQEQITASLKAVSAEIAKL